MDSLKRLDSWELLAERIPLLGPGEAAALLEGGCWEASGRLVPPPALDGPYSAAAMLWLMARAGERAPQGLAPTQGICLDLRGEPLAALPTDLGSFSSLRELYLCGNGLADLPEALGELQHLSVLSLGDNRISSLPSSISGIWMTLSKLYLGDNRISSLPFHEDDMPFIDHGCIGSNPLPEPVGDRWMLRADALEAADRIIELFDAAASSPSHADARSMVQLGFFLATHLDDPMIYGHLFRDVSIGPEGVVAWTSHFTSSSRRQPWLRFAALRLLPCITRGSIVHPSLWRRNISHLDLSGERLPSIPEELSLLGGCTLSA
jgi:Leucine-rich repeat (LRR) protein